MVHFDGGDTKPEGSGGDFIDKEGTYHFTVADYDPSHENDVDPQNNNRFNGNLTFTFQVLAGDHDDQTAKTSKQTYYLGKSKDGGTGNMDRMIELACAMGLYTKKQWREAVEKKLPISIDFDQCIGRQFIAKVAHEEDYKKAKNADGSIKRYWRVGGWRDFFALGDPEVNGKVKTDPEWASLLLQAFGGKLPTKEGDLVDPIPYGHAPAGGSTLGPANGQQPMQSDPKPQTPPPATETGGAGDLF